MNTPKDFGGFACITEAEQLLDAIESGDLEQIPQLADNLRCALSYTKLDTPRMSEEFNLLLTILRYGPDKKKEKEGRESHKDKALRLAKEHRISIWNHDNRWFVKRISSHSRPFHRALEHDAYSLVISMCKK